MRLSDIKGKRSLSIVADAMELAEMIGDDERFADMVDDFKKADKDGIWRVFCKRMPPILREDRYADRVVSIMAAASGVTPEEYAEDGELLKDLFELLTTDSEALGFLMGSAVKTE